MKIILNNQHKLNTLKGEMFELLYKELIMKKIKEDIKVIILKGAGKTAFCAGGDFT